MNRMTSPRNKAKVIKVLWLLSKKYEWLSFWAVKYSLHLPFKFPYHRFYKHTFKHLCISCGVFSKSLEIQRPLHPGRCYILASSYLLMCSPSILIEHVKTLYDFCTLAGSEHFSFFVFSPPCCCCHTWRQKAKMPKTKRNWPDISLSLELSLGFCSAWFAIKRSWGKSHSSAPVSSWAPRGLSSRFASRENKHPETWDVFMLHLLWG